MVALPDSGDTASWVCGHGASTFPSMPSGKWLTPPRAPKRRPSSSVGMSILSPAGTSCGADDPGRADRGNTLARRVLPRLRDKPGDSSAEGRPSSPPVGCHPCARAAVLVVPGISAYAEDSSGLHALPPAARAAASKLDFRPAD
jgi:hypothetical protein